MPAYITASNVFCAGGRGTAQVMATVRSGIARIADSCIVDKWWQPIPMGLVPPDALDPLPAEIADLRLPSSAIRMLQLAAPTLRGVVDGSEADEITLYLGLPHPSAGHAAWHNVFLSSLASASGIRINMTTSRVFPTGRSASLKAIESALESISADPAITIVAGGVDTFVDLRRLAALDQEARLLGPHVPDGFIPGEGAGFLVIESAPENGPRPVCLAGAVAMVDPGNRYGEEPARGEGLANVLVELLSRLESPPERVLTTWAGFNGEPFDAKLWGVAQLRHRDLFASTMMLEHPADCLGDTGAAAGAIMTALAQHSLASGSRDGPALIWATSDHGDCGSAMLTAEKTSIESR